MGQEFGQKSEWNAEEPLPWDSTWDHLHRSLQWFVKRLNEVYRHIPAMHEGDNIPNGFEWIECQNPRQCILAFIRYDRHYQRPAGLPDQPVAGVLPRVPPGRAVRRAVLTRSSTPTPRSSAATATLDQRVRDGAAAGLPPPAQLPHAAAAAARDAVPLRRATAPGFGRVPPAMA